MGKVFTGAEAKIYVDNQLVGLYESCNYTVNISTEPIHTLGRFGAHEIAHTAYEAVTVNCGGFRILGQGAFVLPKVPKLQDLLSLGELTITLVDRKTGNNIMTVIGCKGNSYSGGHNAKATSRFQVSYMGTKLSEEDSDQDENNPVQLP
jgi:hypothetical protein